MNGFQRDVRWREITLAVRLFGGTCACGKSVATRRKKRTNLSFKGFLFHHTTYKPGSPRRKDYENPSSTKTNWQYKSDLVSYINDHPGEFILCCRGCHDLIEKLHRLQKARPHGYRTLLSAVDATNT